MPSPTRLHEGAAKTIRQAASLLLSHPSTVHPAHGMCHTDSERRERTIGGVLRWGEVTPRRVVLQVDEGEPREAKALEAQLLRKATAVRAGIARPLSQACRLRLPGIRRPQEAHVTARIEHQ